MNIFILLFYSMVIFVLDEKLSFFSQWTQLSFEVFFISIVVLYFHRIKIPQHFIQKVSFNDVILLILNMLLGGIIYYVAYPVGAIVPFDFFRIETLLMLILVGPIIEECIFRHVLFLPLINLIRRKWFSIVVISMIFSYAHLRALFGLGGASFEIKSFVIYQGIYTFVISIAWSYLRLKRKSLLIAILLHMSFNFGFGISGLIDKANLFKTPQIKILVADSLIDQNNFLKIWGNQVKPKIYFVEETKPDQIFNIKVHGQKRLESMSILF